VETHVDTQRILFDSTLDIGRFWVFLFFV